MNKKSLSRRVVELEENFIERIKQLIDGSGNQVISEYILKHLADWRASCDLNDIRKIRDELVNDFQKINVKIESYGSSRIEELRGDINTKFDFLLERITKLENNIGCSRNT